MKLSLSPKETALFVGSKAEVKPVYGYENEKRVDTQSVDEATGHKLWSVDAELISGEEVESMRIKIASANEPEINARTEYRVNGEILVTPYIAGGSNRVALSVLVRGSLVAPGGAAPKL